MGQVQHGEREFLEALSRHESLQEEGAVLDGAALVFGISRGTLHAEMVVEMRVPSVASQDEENQPGLIWVYLQNRADARFDAGRPEFMYTSGLRLPWKTGFTPLVNDYRGELGEVLSWKVPIFGGESLPMIAREVRVILGKCRAIVEAGQ